LVFSVQEAKGLEYENVILYNFISCERQSYAAIAAGVSAADVEEGDLEYRRGADKTDKSLEVYKFFINSLYVAVTRAVGNVYLVESDSRHPLLACSRERRANGSNSRSRSPRSKNGSRRRTGWAAGKLDRPTRCATRCCIRRRCRGPCLTAKRSPRAARASISQSVSNKPAAAL
jgi:ATP-dependent exoDNAse (exonuclease V) beta subunit